MAAIIPTHVLQRSQILASIPQPRLAELARSMRERRFKRGEIVFHQGDAGDTLHVLLEGSLKVYVPTDSGDEAVLAILGPGESFGEVALLDAGPRSATVRAMVPSRTATLHRTELFSMLRTHPDAVDALVVSLTRLVRKLTDGLVDLAVLDVSARLARKLADLGSNSAPAANGSIELPPVTQEELAGMVSATRASVNKALGALEATGAIERRGRKIAIRSLDLLRRRGGL